MPKYDIIYRAKPSAEVERQTVTAGSDAEARQRIEQHGGKVLAIVGKGEEGKSFWRRLLLGRISIRFGVSTSELALLCEVLKALYSTGVSLLQAFQMAIDETPNPWLRKRLIVVLDRLREGSDIADAMGSPECIRAFPPLMRETIRTGVANGRLDRSLDRLAEIYKRAAETKRETITAMIYPIIAIIVFSVVCSIIAIMVPNALQDAVGGENELKALMPKLPKVIQFLYFLRNHREYLALPPIALLATAILWWVGMKYHATRLALTRLQRKVPLIGAILYQFALVRLLDLLSANQETGIPVTESLGLIKRSVSDALLEEAVDRARVSILKKGIGLDEAFRLESQIPGLARQMVTAGVTSGRLSEMLSPVISFYREQAKALLKRALDMMTPIMIILLGAIIGPVLIGVFRTLILLQQVEAFGVEGL